MATSQTECSLPESIRCYLLRGNVMVPLVPADQLPFQLKGIPRQLSHRQMSDEGWKLFKETKEVPLLLSIQAPLTNDSPSHHSSGRPQYLAPDHHVRTESQISQTTINRAGQTLLATMDAAPESPDAPFTGAAERLSPLTDAVASIYPNDALRLGYTSSTISGLPKKVYCTHWIATGECRWTLTGCKYKHEMPGTEKLRELGFTRGTPKWWKEKNAVSPPKSMTWLQRRLARTDDEEPQSADMPSPRAFPDPSTLRKRRLEDRSDDAGNENQKRTVVPKDQSMASKPSLPVSPSIRTPPVRGSSQTPNLIDLEDITIPPGRSPGSLISNSEASDSSPHLAPRRRFDTPHPDFLSSSPAPSSSPPLPAPKTKPTKRVCPRRNRAHQSSSPSPPSSSTASSSSSSSEEESSDTDAPRTRTRSRKIHYPRRTHYRNKITCSNTTAGAAPRLVKSAKNAEQPQLGLASSKYAVQTNATSSKTHEDKDAQAEQSTKKAYRKERRGERSGQ